MNGRDKRRELKAKQSIENNTDLKVAKVEDGVQAMCNWRFIAAEVIFSRAHPPIC